MHAFFNRLLGGIYSGNKLSGSRYHLFSHKQKIESHTVQVAGFALHRPLI